MALFLFSCVCRLCEYECAKLLLGASAAVNQAKGDGVTPLSIACQEGQLECVQLLLGADAAVNQAKQTGATPLFIACHGAPFTSPH